MGLLGQLNGDSAAGSDCHSYADSDGYAEPQRLPDCNTRGDLDPEPDGDADVHGNRSPNRRGIRLCIRFSVGERVAIRKRISSGNRDTDRFPRAEREGRDLFAGGDRSRGKA